jgi:DNA-binding response OmpR family regulator
MSAETSPVLVVEDEELIRFGISEILRQAGYSVVTAESGEQALAMLESVAPRLVLLDLRLPGLDGESFAREAKARGHVLTICVVSATPRDVPSMVDLGVVTWLEKPFNVDELLVRVSALAGPPM